MKEKLVTVSLSLTLKLFFQEVALHPTKLLLQYACPSYYIIHKTEIVSGEMLELVIPHYTRSFHWQILKHFPQKMDPCNTHEARYNVNTIH
jgi:hypothetical protein